GTRDWIRQNRREWCGKDSHRRGRRMHVFSQACGRDEESERGVRRNRICQYAGSGVPMKRIIFSGKGGVGKTTILSNLARLLARDSNMLLVIDCDPSMNLAMSLGIPLSDVDSLAKDRSHLWERLGPQAEEQEHGEHGLECTEEDLDEFIIPAADGV